MLVEPLPEGTTLTCLMDCCHSGTGLDLPYVRIPKSKDESMMAKASKLKSKSEKFAKLKTIRKFNAPGESIADVVLYSGCRDDQTSADSNIGGSPTGAMTYAFTTALKNNPHLTYYGLLSDMRDILAGRFSQLPQLSTGNRMDLNVPIRL